MKNIVYLTAGLLILTGLLKVAQVVNTADANAPITVVFGVLYLAIAAILLFGVRLGYYLGVLVPLAGLLLAIAGMATNPTTLLAIFIVTDAVIVACCAYLALEQRRMSLLGR